jgi:hypothetical protein
MRTASNKEDYSKPAEGWHTLQVSTPGQAQGSLIAQAKLYSNTQKPRS